MFQRFFKFIDEHKPAALKGGVHHVVRWVLSDFYEKKYENPGYQFVATEDEDGYMALEKTHKLAVYFIHGTADRPASLSTMKNRLIEKLPDEIGVLHLVEFEGRGQGKDIPFFAEQLARIIKQNNDTDVMFFGYSRGSLVVWEVSVRLAEKMGIRVHGIVTLGAPFGGSPWAVWPFTEISDSVKQMQPGNEYLKDLCEAVEKSDIPSLPFAGEKDTIVPAKFSCVEAHRHKLIVLEGHNHVSMPDSRKMIERTFEFIDNEVLVAFALSHPDLLEHKPSPNYF